MKALPFYPNGIKSVRGGVYFSDGRGQLWKSDLTDAGTTLVRDIPPGFVFHDLTPAAITSTGDGVFFRAVDAAIGTELWRSDGTADGTMPVIDLNPLGGSAPSELLNVRGTLYFSATDGQRGYELWRSDGTAAGTVLVKDINPTGDAWPTLLRLVGDTIYFSADDGTGPELWKSDGTEAGHRAGRRSQSGRRHRIRTRCSRIGGDALLPRRRRHDRRGAVEDRRHGGGHGAGGRRRTRPAAPSPRTCAT